MNIRGLVVKIKKTGQRFRVIEARNLSAACDAIMQARVTGAVGWKDTIHYTTFDDRTRSTCNPEIVLAHVRAIDSAGNEVQPS